MCATLSSGWLYLTIIASVALRFAISSLLGCKRAATSASPCEDEFNPIAGFFDLGREKINTDCGGSNHSHRETELWGTTCCSARRPLLLAPVQLIGMINRKQLARRQSFLVYFPCYVVAGLLSFIFSTSDTNINWNNCDLESLLRREVLIFCRLSSIFLKI